MVSGMAQWSGSHFAYYVQGPGFDPLTRGNQTNLNVVLLCTAGTICNCWCEFYVAPIALCLLQWEEPLSVFLATKAMLNAILVSNSSLSICLGINSLESHHCRHLSMGLERREMTAAEWTPGVRAILHSWAKSPHWNISQFLSRPKILQCSWPVNIKTCQDRPKSNDKGTPLSL